MAYSMRMTYRKVVIATAIHTVVTVSSKKIKFGKIFCLMEGERFATLVGQVIARRIVFGCITIV